MDPITWAGIGATAGSTLLNMSANDSVQGARSGVQRAEANRQGGYDSNINALNDKSINNFGGFGTDMDKRSQSVSDFYSTSNGGLPSSGPTTGTMPESKSNIVVQEGKRQGDKVAAFNNQQNGALAKLRSFGDTLSGKIRDNTQNTSAVGMWNGFKRGSASILPMELENANHAGDGMKTFADILGGLGKVATFAGLSGGSDSIMNMFGTGNPISSTVHGPMQPGFFGRIFGGARG